MHIFSKGKTHEARITELEASLTQMTAERDTAASDLALAITARDESGTHLAAVILERDEAVALVTGLETQLEAANAAAGEQSTLLRSMLALPADSPLTQESIRTGLTALAHVEAVNIAASQGAAPLPTEPRDPGASDDPVKAAFAAAQAETHPTRRAYAFAAARELMEKKSGKKISGLN